MIDLEDATKIAETALEEIGIRMGVDLKISHISESECFWEFYFDSVDWLENGDLSSALAGNLPFKIMKIDGSVEMPPS